jgi:integrase
MTIAKLERKTITKLPATDGVWWDDSLKGFGYLQRTDASGALRKSFVLQYRFGKQQRKIKLGDAAKLNADQARKIAIKLFGQILEGVDPQAVKEAERIEAAKLTFAQAVDQYLEMKKAEVRPASLKLAELYLSGTKYFPTLHRKPIDSITRADIAPHLDRIGVDSGTASAGRARAHLSSLFRWALRRGHCRENPVLATEAPKIEAERERVLSADELRQVWNGCGDDDYGRIIRLLILTGCRREEIGGLRWSEINLDQGTLTIPAERSKNHRAHTLPLSAMALDILRAVPQRDGRDHLFGQRSDGFQTWAHSKRALLKAVGAMKEWRLHDLRHTLSTGLNELGVEPHHVEAILNHVSGHKDVVAGRYNHAQYRSQMAQALALWADHVRAVVTGTAPKVVALKRSA